MEKHYDEELENVLLGTVIHYPEEYNNVAKYIVKPDVFYQTKAKRLWEIVTNMVKDKDEINLVTISSSLSNYDIKRGVTKVYVVDVTTQATIGGSAKIYAKRVYEKYLLRQVVDEAKSIERKAIEGRGDVYGTIISAHNHLASLIELKPDATFNIDDELIDAINSITAKETKLLKTCYESVDRFAGGLTRGEITIVGGRPGHGKTTFLLNLLSNMVNAGLKVMLFNRELPNSEMLKKLITLESGNLSYGMVRKGVYEEQELKELQRVKVKISELYNSDKFAMFDSIRDFATTATEIAKFKPDVVFDDYIQLITPNGKEDNRRLQLERLVNDYKCIAKEHMCAVVLASQLNRGVEYRGDGEPRLSDLAESGAIEQVAENVFFVYYEHKVDASKDKNILRLKASKVRYGESGSSDLGYNGDKVKIYNSFEEYLNPPKEKINEQKEIFNEEDIPF